MDWLRHAFAVESPGPAGPTDAERPVVDRLCVEIVRRHLAAPALAFLETSRPLNSLAAQAIHFFAPLLSLIMTGGQHRRFAEFLERRGSIDFLCSRIDQLESQARAAQWKHPAPASAQVPRPDTVDSLQIASPRGASLPTDERTG